MASPNTLRLRAALAQLRPMRGIVPGTHVEPIFRTFNGKKFLVGAQPTGMPYINTSKDRTLRGKARRRARRGGDR